MYIRYIICKYLLPVGMGFPGGSNSKESTFNSGDPCSIPGLGRSPGGGHGNPLQYSCLENPHGQGSLVCMGSQRVGHNWATKHCTVGRWPFHFVDSLLHCAKAFYFDIVPFVHFYLFCLRHIEKGYYQYGCQRDYCLFSSRSFIVSGFTFNSLIHFEFIFERGLRE